MRYFLLCLFLYVSQVTFGQKSVVDSLYTRLENNPEEDSLRVRILLQLCWHESTSYPEKHKQMAEEAIKISKKINYQSGAAAGIRSIGIYYMNQGEYDKATKQVYEALQLFEKIPDLKGVGNCYQTLGSIHRQRADLEKSKEYYGKAIEVYQKINNEKDMAGTLNSLGVLHISFSKFDEALSYINQSLEIRKKINDRYGISQSYTNMSIIYTNQKKYKEALACFEKNLPLVEEMNEKQLIAINLDGMGHLYTLTGDYQKAETSLLKALALAKEIGFKRTIEVAYSKLTQLEEARGRYKEAMVYSNLAYQYLDSAYSEESAAQIAEAETRYETEKKNQTIAVLERDNRIQQLRTNIWLTSCLLITGMSIGVYFFQRYRESNKRRILNLRIDNLIAQHKELSERYKGALTPSIDGNVASYDQVLLKKSLDIIEANMSNSLFGVDQMADAMGMSRASLHRKLKSVTGFPPSEFIRNIRLRKAAALLSSQADSVTQIGIAVGFEDQSYFSKSFKKEFGVPPSEYMQSTKLVESLTAVNP
ncbi:MAG: tetratricopeptide repeat protein [Cyclobacteriaceae bacterium]|jgi:AraC-like DNA-binding protein/Tfp pilus assembly protein PilF